MIVLTATLRARPGRRDALVAGLDAIRVEAEHEPGTLTFAVHTARDDDRLVVCYEAYADEAAMATHREGRALRALMAVIGDLIEGAPEIVYLEPVSSASR
jgi:quinol monooxygenase YgiN